MSYSRSRVERGVGLGVNISNWRCYGCLKVFENWIDYYHHFEKVYRVEEEVEKEELAKYERLSELCERQRNEYNEWD